MQGLRKTEIQQIKKLLVSRDEKNILSALNKIETLLNKNAEVQLLIKNDISQFLCEAMDVIGDAGVKIMYNVFKKLTSHSDFFKHDYASLVIESIVRRAQFLAASSESVLDDSINLLTVLISGHETHNQLIQKSTIGSLVTLFTDLLRNQNMNLETKVQLGLFLKSLLSLRVLKFSKKVGDLFLEGCWKCFMVVNDVTRQLKGHHHIMVLYFDLCALLLRMLSVPTFCLESKTDLRGQLLDDVGTFLVDVGGEQALQIHASNSEPNVMANVLRTVLYVLEESSQSANVAHKLAFLGYLQLVTQGLSDTCGPRGVYNGPSELQSLYMTLLIRLLLVLAKDVFDFPALWPEGWQNFSEHVTSGLERLPSDDSHWLVVFADPKSDWATRLALLVYLFFYAITTSSQESNGAVHPFIVSFLAGSDLSKAAPLVVKMVWFVYAISSLSCSVNCPGADDALQVLLNLVTKRNDAEVFVHHPAMLYWAFLSKEIPPSVQCLVVRLWLDKQEPDCSLLETLMKEHTDARHAVLDIVQTGTGPLLKAALTSIQTVLLDPSSDDLAHTVWHLLPKIFAKKSAAAIDDNNLKSMIQLATLRIPAQPNLPNVASAGVVYPKIMTTLTLSSVVDAAAAHQLAYYFLQWTIDEDDYRVVDVYLRNHSMLRTVAAAVESSERAITAAALKTVTLLWSSDERVSDEFLREKVPLELRVLPGLLNHQGDTQCIAASLEFTQLLLRSEFHSAIFAPVEPVGDELKRNLFFELQNLCFKNPSELQTMCWSCLELCLHTNVAEINSNPWIHQLILTQLPDIAPMQSFLLTWLNKNEQKCSEARRICPSYLTKTILGLVDVLMTSPNPEYRELYLKIAEQEVPIPVSTRDVLEQIYRYQFWQQQQLDL